jgi:RNA polymerase sigma-70 factor (ECF subfamily)
MLYGPLKRPFFRLRVFRNVEKMSAPVNRPGQAKRIDHWLAQARGGSEEALGRLLELCRSYLLLVANEQLGDNLQAKVGASDLVQETCLRAHAHFERFHGGTERELLAWLRRILINHLANVARHFQAGGRDREVALNHGDSSLPLGNRVADEGPSPSSYAMAREANEDLCRALEKLPDDYRQAVRLRQWENLPFDEIGRRMGRSAEAARQLWRRAVERLAEFLEPPREYA